MGRKERGEMYVSPGLRVVKIDAFGGVIRQEAGGKESYVSIDPLPMWYTPGYWEKLTDEERALFMEPRVLVLAALERLKK